MKTKILVTGGLGFIGSHLVEKLVDLDYQVYVLDNLSAPAAWQLPPKVKLFLHDVSQPSVIDLVARIKPTVIFHLAADKLVSAGSAAVLKSNVIGTFNLLEAGKAAKIKQFIFASSAAVYGNPEILPLQETHPTRPLSGYGLSKLVGELYCRQYQSDLITSIFRFANVYGPRQSNSSEGGVVAIFISNLIKQFKSTIYGDGQQTRDFVFVKEVVDALILALKNPANFTLNIGSQQSTGILSLLNLIAKIIKVKPIFIKKNARPLEIKDSLFDCSLAHKTLTWQSKTKLIDGLYETINYFTSL